jgi:hypothetical protein
LTGLPAAFSCFAADRHTSTWLPTTSQLARRFSTRFASFMSFFVPQRDAAGRTACVKRVGASSTSAAANPLTLQVAPPRVCSAWHLATMFPRRRMALTVQIDAPGVQTPSLQRSSTVHAFPSRHSASSIGGLDGQAASSPEQTASAWHGLALVRQR